MSALDFEVDYESKLFSLLNRINSRTYFPSTSICFVATRPKYREVFAAAFEDRVVHHYIALRLEPLFEEIFSDRTFNCRKGKGQLYGIKMLVEDIKKCSNNYTKDCYIMKLDLKGFFMSIDKILLSKMIDDFIIKNYKNSDIDEIRYLCNVIIKHDPEKDCEKRSPLWMWRFIPNNKSLFTNGKDKGIAIGNLFSQHFANFLLNKLDWFMESIGIKYHGRYVDDFYMIHEDKAKLLDCIHPIRVFLSELGLQLNEKKFYIQHYAKGVKFTGVIVKPYRTYCGSRVISNFKNSVVKLNTANNIEDVKKSVSSINSYLGILRQHNEYSNRKKILRMIDDKIFKYVYIKGHYESLAIKSRYKNNGKINITNR